MRPHTFLSLLLSSTPLTLSAPLNLLTLTPPITPNFPMAPGPAGMSGAPRFPMPPGPAIPASLPSPVDNKPSNSSSLLPSAVKINQEAATPTCQPTENDCKEPESPPKGSLLRAAAAEINQEAAKPTCQPTDNDCKDPVSNPTRRLAERSEGPPFSPDLPLELPQPTSPPAAVVERSPDSKATSEVLDPTSGPRPENVSKRGIKDLIIWISCHIPPPNKCK